MSRSPGVQRVPPPFRQIADHYALQIRTGKLKIGDFLPPREQIVQTWEVSHATAAKATDLLKQRGLVETVPARGLRVIARPQGS
jgi:DNA-binding GntR family transcriptional regulator